ncbi:hypothetical protein, partial [Haemophilus parainfluenzae]|uniref:hypothetical protein n=1 Tax=Haemophilus parainfluenzae TaxID=729 RepID=UPI001CED2578
YIEVYEDPHLGWDCRVQGQLQIVDLPGGHSSMLQEPYVTTAATLFRTQLADLMNNRLVSTGETAQAG